MSSSTITICIPVKNEIKYIKECIDSVLNQTNKDWKVVIVDGYSSDGTWEYLQRYRENSSFKIYQGLQQGLYQDWNYATTKVETEWMVFLPGDDVLEKKSIDTFYKAIQGEPNISNFIFKNNFIAANSAELWNNDTIISRVKPYLIETKDRVQYLNFHQELIACILGVSHYITMPALLIRTNHKHLIPTDYGLFGDVIYYLERVKSQSVKYIPEMVASWRIHDEQLTNTNPNLKAVEKRRKILDKFSEDLLKTEISTLQQFLEFEEEYIIYDGDVNKIKNDKLVNLYKKVMNSTNAVAKMKSEIITKMLDI